MVFKEATADLFALQIRAPEDQLIPPHKSSEIILTLFEKDDAVLDNASGRSRKRKLELEPTMESSSQKQITLGLLSTTLIAKSNLLDYKTLVDSDLETDPLEIEFCGIRKNDEDKTFLEFSKYGSPSDQWTCIISFTNEKEMFAYLKKLENVNSLLGKFKQLRNLMNIRSSVQLLFKNTSCCLCFVFEISLKVGLSILDLRGPNWMREQAFDILEMCLPVGPHKVVTEWAPCDFYNNVHVPNASGYESLKAHKNILVDRLYPFQRRAVEWLLAKEGYSIKQVNEDNKEQLSDSSTISLSFWETRDAHGVRCFVSHLLGLIFLEADQIPRAIPWGGILAEEMGLGKTVEIITLINLHKRAIDLRNRDFFDTYTSSFVRRSSATLIITPSSILQQWKSEISAHAPHMKVHHYQGIFSRSSACSEIDKAVENLVNYDIVLSTYNVLAREIWYAMPTSDRQFRHEKKFKQKKSPLVQIHWWRVCLDEAQMVEGGVSNAATVTRLIPRRNAWAITGTPLRRDHKDLHGLFLFLRYEPYASSWRLWDRMLTYFRDDFRNLIRQSFLRHTKEKIRHELEIPLQKRYVLFVPFTAVEEQNYNSLYQEMCWNCRLSTDGSPLKVSWDPNNPDLIDTMRKWLTRLRQACLHPSTGFRNRKALGKNAGTLRTVKEVLDAMMDQNLLKLRIEERAWLLNKLRIGHVLAFAGDDEMRAQKALEVYLDVLSESEKLLGIQQKDLNRTTDKQLIGEQADASDVQSQKTENNFQATERLIAMRNSVRLMQEIKHSSAFFAATAYYQIRANKTTKNSSSSNPHKLQDLENKYYEIARGVRASLLNDTQCRAQTAMIRISQKDSPCPRSLALPYFGDPGGIESRRTIQKLTETCGVINKQKEKLVEWMSRVRRILLAPLVDEDGVKESTGDEYEDSTKQQDELYTYMTVLRAMIADRTFGFTGRSNELANHEMNLQLQESRSDQGHRSTLLKKFVDERDTLRLKNDQYSLRTIMYKFRSLASDLQTKNREQSNRVVSELLLIENILETIQDSFTIQMKNNVELERDLEAFRACTNLRLEFYKQLQHLSDQVKPYKDELDNVLDFDTLRAAHNRDRECVEKIAILKTKDRFLGHIREENLNLPEQKTCVICQCTFEIGILTVCGHIYCKECINAWWREHKTCPLCKSRLNRTNFHDISYKPLEMQMVEEQIDSGQSVNSSSVLQKQSIYDDVQESVLNEIKTIDLSKSHGTKIDMLSRHLLWLRTKEFRPKSIIFSQYSDFLSLLEGALKTHNINCARITHKFGIDKFTEDQATECFLLDAKANSSGLNLVQATTVFLCEPLVNTAIELQAIARVHRIGQKRPTTVYMYLIPNTVEQAIYRLSLNRRLEHVKKLINCNANGDKYTQSNDASTSDSVPLEQETAIDAANSRELEHVAPASLLQKGTAGGEAVDTNDLWSCLFGHLQEQKQGPTVQLGVDLGHWFKEDAYIN